MVVERRGEGGSIKEERSTQGTAVLRRIRGGIKV